MVKLGEIETSLETIPLESLKLGDLLTLKAVREKVQTSSTEKVGGIIITFVEKDIQEGHKKQRQISQKYSKSFASVLEDYMIKLKIKDTIEFQHAFYIYEVQKVGKNIFPRLFPIRKA